MKTKGKSKEDAKTTVPNDEVAIGYLANVLGISLRTAQRHSQSGLFPIIRVKNRSNMYSLSKCVQNFINHKVSECEQKNEKDKVEVQKVEKLKAETLLKQSQAELHELKTDIQKGKFIAVEVVQKDYQHFFTVFKKFAMAIPSRVGGTVSGYVEPTVSRGIESSLQKEINDMLRNFVVAGQSLSEDGDKK